jgi:hypothetical protein
MLPKEPIKRTLAKSIKENPIEMLGSSLSSTLTEWVGFGPIAFVRNGFQPIGEERFDEFVYYANPVVNFRYRLECRPATC